MSKPFCAITWGYVLERQAFIPVRCDQWQCDYCRRIKSLRLAQRAVAGMAKMIGQPAFWTLTLPGHMKSVSFAYKVLPTNWDNLRKRIQRTTAKLYYFAVVEGQRHRNGMPHFHILCDVRLSSKKGDAAEERALKAHALKCGFGYQCDVKSVDGNGVLYYVAKYVSKADTNMPKGFRRVRTSQDWPPLPEFEASGTLLQWSMHETFEQWTNYLSQATGLHRLELQGDFMATVDELSKGRETMGVRLE